jgi:hypothetical protein
MRMNTESSPHRIDAPVPNRAELGVGVAQNRLQNCLHVFAGAENEKGRISAALIVLGSSTWARTRDLRINSPALYPLSYRGTTKRAF